MVTIGPLELEIIQISGILFALFAWSRAFLRYRNKVMSSKGLFFWSVVWASMIVVALQPGLISTVADFIGIGRGTDVLIYISIIVLFYLMFRVYVKAENTEQTITKLVRQIAIEKKTKKK